MTEVIGISYTIETIQDMNRWGRWGRAHNTHTDVKAWGDFKLLNTYHALHLWASMDCWHKLSYAVWIIIYFVLIRQLLLTRIRMRRDKGTHIPSRFFICAMTNKMKGRGQSEIKVKGTNHKQINLKLTLSGAFAQQTHGVGKINLLFIRGVVFTGLSLETLTRFSVLVYGPSEEGDAAMTLIGQWLMILYFPQQINFTTN